MRLNKFSVTINTTGGDGAATGSGEVPISVVGYIEYVRLDYHASAPASTDVVLSDTDHGTIHTESNNAAGVTRYPRQAGDKYLIDGPVTVTVAQSNALTGAVTVTVAVVLESLLNVDSVGLTDYKNVVVVDAGGNGDFTTLSAALAAIVDASVSNRYGIVMMPGIHTETATINLKEGIDIGALIPGTVQINAAVGLTGGLIQCGGASAITEKVTLFGLNFKMPDGAAGNVFQMNSTYVAQVSIRDCKLYSDASTPCVGTAGTLASLLELINSELQCGDLGGSSVVSINSSYQVVIDKCTITQNQTTGTTSGVLLVHATPSLRARICTLFGGAYSFRAGTARTASIALCAMQKAMSNVTSTITTPYNVIDANL